MGLMTGLLPLCLTSFAEEGSRPKPGTRMLCVVSPEHEVLPGDLARPVGRRTILAELWDKRCAVATSISQQLAPDLSTQQLSNCRRDSIADLSVLSSVITFHRIVVREGLNAVKLPRGEVAASPVERTRSGSGRGLDRPGRAVLGELKEERPEACPPPEQRLAAAA